MESKHQQKNVFGKPLRACCEEPMTGFYRTGYCQTGPEDFGAHVVCAEMTETFLKFSTERGNDLSTPRPEFNFPGLKPGDRWCVCAARWKEAEEAGCAPPVALNATHERALEIVELSVLERYACG